MMPSGARAGWEQLPLSSDRYQLIKNRKGGGRAQLREAEATRQTDAQSTPATCSGDATIKLSIAVNQKFQWLTSTYQRKLAKSEA